MNTCRARYRDCLSLKQIPPPSVGAFIRIAPVSLVTRHLVRAADFDHAKGRVIGGGVLALNQVGDGLFEVVHRYARLWPALRLKRGVMALVSVGTLCTVRRTQ